MSRYSALVGALIIFAIAAQGTSASAHSAATSSRRATTHSAVVSMPHRATCIYTRNDLSELRALERRIGKNFDCVLAYNDTAPDWKTFERPWFTNTTPANADVSGWVRAAPHQRRLVIAQELIPANVTGAWRRAGLHGRFDGHIRLLARNLVAAGLGNSVIRLGHEANGTWYHDNVGSSRGTERRWAKYWDRFVTVMRSVRGAHFVFDWNINNGARPIPLANYYPGNRYVDVVGVDIYDGSGGALPANPQQRWRAIADQPGGLRTIMSFAAKHGKPLSFPEWGLLEGSRAHGAGDDPAFVEHLVSIIRSSDFAYQSYFDVNDYGLLEIQRAPRALAVYRASFGKLSKLDTSAF
jgi:hypothetical protein